MTLTVQTETLLLLALPDCNPHPSNQSDSCPFFLVFIAIVTKTPGAVTPAESVIADEIATGNILALSGSGSVVGGADTLTPILPQLWPRHKFLPCQGLVQPRVLFHLIVSCT